MKPGIVVPLDIKPSGRRGHGRERQLRGAAEAAALAIPPLPRVAEVPVLVAPDRVVEVDPDIEQAQRLHSTEVALHASEARCRALTMLSSDWYWEIDEARCFTKVLEHGKPGSAGMACPKVGMTFLEAGADGDDTEREALEIVMLARRPFFNFQYTLAGADGGLHTLSVSGTPIVELDGRFTGYRGIGRDITERKREERILALEHRVARCLAEPGDAQDTIDQVLRAICQSLGWTAGVHFQVSDRGDVLHASRFWGVPGGRAADYFASLSGVMLLPGMGVAGQVWQTCTPLWLPDIDKDSRPLRPDLMHAAGWRGVIGFPCVAGGKVSGVFMFFLDKVVSPDERVLAALGVMGGQVGRFLQHRQSEVHLRESEARYRALIELSTDWYWEHDEEGRFTRISGDILERLGTRVEDFIGKTRWETVTSYDPQLRAAMEDDIAARRSFRDFQFLRVAENGVARHVQVSGAPIFDEAGKYKGYRGVGRDITHSKLAEDRLRFQALLLAAVDDAVFAADLDGKVTYWNASAERLYGWSATEALGSDVHDMTGIAAQRSRDLAAIGQASGSNGWRGEILACRRNSTTFTAQVTLAAILNEQGAIAGTLGVSRDISAIKRRERALADYARQQTVLAAFGQAALASTNPDDLLAQAAVAIGNGLNVTFCHILEYTPDRKALVVKAGLGWPEGWKGRHMVNSAADGADPVLLFSTEAAVIDDLQADATFAGSDWAAVHGIRSCALVPIGGASGPFGMLGAYSRQTGNFPPGQVEFLTSVATTLATALDRGSAGEKAAFLAQFDALTGLPNRNLLRDHLSNALAQAQRRESGVGVMFIDLDGFKNVNDSLGHAAGDELLNIAAQRLEDCVRDGDRVGRLGGDEFAIVLSELESPDESNIVALRVLNALSRPFQVAGQEVQVTASLGIAVYPADGDGPDLLLKNADTAMYRAKELGRNGCQFFTEELNVRVAGRMTLERELRRAIERREFTLHYQPELSMDSGKIIGVEALLRWQHPERGLLAPADFIQLAEETGLILPIGQWVVETACQQAAEWHRRGHSELFVAVNVSPLEIRRGDLVENIRRSLASSGLKPCFLEIELTETVGIDGPESFIRTLDALKAIGVTIAIDDFGSGYSMLGYLKRFPIDKMKMDRMFINDILSEVDDDAIVQAIIAMSHHLKLKVTAEGVETANQAAFLHRCRCDSVQGYLFGRPMEAEQLGAMLDRKVVPETWSGPRSSLRSLLLVDDNPEALELLKRIFKVDGYDIHTATSAQQALDLLSQTRIAVVMSDQRMPGMSGIEFLRRVKVMYPDTLRIVLTAHSDPETVKSAVNEGAVYKFCDKTDSNAVLRDEVRQAFHRHELDTLRKVARSLPEGAQA